MPRVSMSSAVFKAFIIISLTTLVLGFLFTLRNKSSLLFVKETVSSTTKHRDASSDLFISIKVQRILQQRNEVSRQLNEMKKLYGQQSCQNILTQKKAQVSENGGWCKKFSGGNSTEHAFDEGFSTALSSFLEGKSVGSFGEGPGMYKKHLDQLREVKSYIGFDGAPFCEETTEGRVKFLDLTATQYGLPAFDWVMSVEVGEHIPAKFEDIYIDNLVRHAREGLILSWALPEQGGFSHVNTKTLEAVKDQLGRRGFDINIEAGKPLRDAAKFYWLKNNVHVYYRNSSDSFVQEDV